MPADKEYTVPMAKCFVTVGTGSSNPSDLDLGNSNPPPSKKAKHGKHKKTVRHSNNGNRKLWNLIQTHNFAKQAEIFIPRAVFERIHEKLEASIPVTFFYRISCRLHDILSSEFFNQYIKKNSCLLISESQLDHQDVYAMVDGKLHLSLQSDTFRRAGLSNVQVQKPNPRISHSYRITYDLRSPTSVPGNATFDRLMWALKNTLNTDEDVYTFAFVTLNQNGDPIEMDPKLAVQFETLVNKKYKQTANSESEYRYKNVSFDHNAGESFFDAYDLLPGVTHLPDLSMPSLKIPDNTFKPIAISTLLTNTENTKKTTNNNESADTSESRAEPLPRDIYQETIQEWAFSIAEWLSLISLNSDQVRVKGRATVDSYLSSYEIFDEIINRPVDISVLSFAGGLIPSNVIKKAWEIVIQEISICEKNQVSCSESLKKETDNQNKNDPNSKKKQQNEKEQHYQPSGVDLGDFWSALCVHGVEDTPVSWNNRMHVVTENGGENNYTIIRLPKQTFQNSLVGSEKSKESTNLTPEDAYQYVSLQYLDSKDP